MKLPILINESNTQKIIDAIDEVQKKSRERKITIEDITTTISQIEARLQELKIPKTKWRNMEFLYSNGYKMPNAYKYTPESTQFAIVYLNSWRLTRIFRDRCNYTDKIRFLNENDYKEFYKF